MDRRKFNASLLAATAGINLVDKSSLMRKKILPERLRPGDMIGLIAPAGVMSEEKIKKTREKLISYGFRIKEGKYLSASYGYLAGKDEERLEDLHAMYSDPEVKGIWCARGGYGITRILDKVDYRLIRKNPKVLIGFSDITALLNTIYAKTGVIGFHGPLGASEDNTFSREILRDLVMHPDKKVTIKPYFPVDTEYDDLVTIKKGIASGEAAGGNLSLLTAMIGTPYEVKYRSKIVFIEDVGESPYRIDRMLTQLVSASDIKKAAGIAMGQWKGCHPSNPDRSLSLLDVLRDKLASLDIPCIYGLNFGHVDHNFTFPIGGTVKVNFNTGEINVLEQLVG